MAGVRKSGPPPIVLGGLALAAVAALQRLKRLKREEPSHPDRAEVREAAARKLHGGAATLALAVLADSGVEHYRGMFANKAMFTPLVTASVSALASLHGLLSRDPLPRPERRAAYGLAAASGLIGTGFHVYNVGKRPSGYSFENLFYGAPLGAPAAMILAGAVGWMAERVREAGPEEALDLPDTSVPLGQGLAALTALGLLGTTAEAALLHFRGAFHNKVMYMPVLIPPVSAALLGWAGLNPAPRPRRLARIGMRVAALLGFAGAGFHIYGVSRHMGGWKNWRQNLLDGPPIPAPPSFTGLALAGLAALSLLEESDDA